MKRGGIARIIAAALSGIWLAISSFSLKRAKQRDRDAR
jgi:hypothetical protein